MLLKRSPDLKYSDVTPRHVYLNRRKFLYGMGLAGGLALGREEPGEPRRSLGSSLRFHKARRCHQRARSARTRR